MKSLGWFLMIPAYGAVMGLCAFAVTMSAEAAWIVGLVATLLVGAVVLYAERRQRA